MPRPKRIKAVKLKPVAPGSAADNVTSYGHPESKALLRPEIGAQTHFKKTKPPQKYRYDDSLSPALEWDGQNPARELGEWLLARIEEASRLPAPHQFAKALITENKCEVPPHKLFPQAFRIVEQYLADWVRPIHPFEKADVWHSPFYGQVLERLRGSIHGDTAQGEAPEIPIYEQHRGLGSSADADFWTSRRVFPVEHSHVNYVVADTKQWEQSAAYFLDTHPRVRSFVKNAGFGFTIPCFYMGQDHDYIPDFIVRLDLESDAFLILETKGFPDEHKEDKASGARRWVKAVNADGRYGFWDYDVAEHPSEVAEAVARAYQRLSQMIKQTRPIAGGRAGTPKGGCLK